MNIKLTPSQILEIYQSVEPHKIIAERFKMSTSNVSAIQTGRTWQEITEGYKPPKRDYLKLTPARALEIYKSKEPLKKLAKRFEVTSCTISSIKTKRIWREATKGHGKPGITHRKLSRLQIVKIYKSIEPPKKIAKRFRIHTSTVSAIKTGRVWREVTERHGEAGKKFTSRQILEIHLSEESQRELAKEFECSKSAIQRIQSKKNVELTQLLAIRNAITKYNHHQIAATQNEENGEMLDAFNGRRLAREALMLATQLCEEKR